MLGRAVHHGCTEPFKRLVEDVIGPNCIYTGLYHRDLDWVEVFSGLGNLSEAMAKVSRRINCLTVKFTRSVLGSITSKLILPRQTSMG